MTMNDTRGRLRRTAAGLLPKSIRSRAGWYLRAPQRWTKRLLRDKRTVHLYLGSQAVKKLQVGAGSNAKPGWLNGDLNPVGAGVIYLDATKRFPLDDGLFQYVFSEHMLEHVPYSAGRNMLNECYRVMAPGGRIRICTPDLANFLNLFRSDRSALENDYLAWATREFIPAADEVAPVFVLNNYVRDWGHQFIYDRPTLARALEHAGFSDVTYHALGESADSHLRGLEYIDRMPPGFLALESMVLEAIKR
jgi:predicted SAM-dependent methyltransferase